MTFFDKNISKQKIGKPQISRIVIANRLPNNRQNNPEERQVGDPVRISRILPDLQTLLSCHSLGEHARRVQGMGGSRRVQTQASDSSARDKHQGEVGPRQSEIISRQGFGGCHPVVCGTVFHEVWWNTEGQHRSDLRHSDVCRSTWAPFN